MYENSLRTLWPVSPPRTNHVSLARNNFNLNGSKANVRVRCRVVRGSIRTADILANRVEGFSLFLPGSSPIKSAARATREALEDRRRDCVSTGIIRRDDIDRYAFVFRHYANIVR